jgi:hypothetical protein
MAGAGCTTPVRAFSRTRSCSPNIDGTGVIGAAPPVPAVLAVPVVGHGDRSPELDDPGQARPGHLFSVSRVCLRHRTGGRRRRLP